MLCALCLGACQREAPTVPHAQPEAARPVSQPGGPARALLPQSAAPVVGGAIASAPRWDQTGDQFETEADRTTVQRIRLALQASDVTREHAPFVQLIATHGSVALHGEVTSVQARRAIEDLVETYVGEGNIVALLHVTGS